MSMINTIDKDTLLLNCVSIRKIAIDISKQYGLESSEAIEVYGILEQAEDVIRRAGLTEEYKAWVEETGLEVKA